MAIADLLTQFLECILYGIYLTTLGFCLRSLLRRDDRNGRRLASPNGKAMLVVAILLAIITTLDSLTSFAFNLYTYEIYAQASGEVKNRFWTIANYISAVDIVLATMLGDGILIYRCWIVYARSWRVIFFPLSLYCAAGVLSILIFYFQSIFPAKSNHVTPIRQLVLACWTCTVFLNILTTSLIIIRIWRVTKHIPGSTPGATDAPISSNERRSEYHRIIRIIIESGLLYTITATANGLTWIFDTEGSSGILGAIDVQAIGIAFNLLIARVHGRSHVSTTPHQSMVADPGGLRFAPVTITLPPNADSEADGHPAENKSSQGNGDASQRPGLEKADEGKVNKIV